MADSEKQKTTAKERQQAKIDQLKARLQKEEAKLRSEARKDRNAQLMALGLYMEDFLRKASAKSCLDFKNTVNQFLSGRNLENAKAAADRILEEKSKAQPKKEISSEPPSQLPEAEATEKTQGSA